MKRQSRFTNRKNSIKNLLHKINPLETLGMLFEIVIAMAVVSIILLIFRPIAGWVLLGILILFWFRLANNIPLIGHRWVWLFGKRRLWDWMSLLCAPLILSILGLAISTSINKGQGDIAIVSDRLNISNEYYKQISELILKNDFQDLVKTQKQNSLIIQVMTKNEIDKYKSCNPLDNNPLSSIGYTRTISTLHSLSSLKTSDETYTPLKKGIIQLLYYSGLISRNAHVISLQRADLSGADLSNIDLSNSCFDSVDFHNASLFRTKLDKSNLRRTNFKKADLRQAKLQGVELVGSSLSGADLRGANLKMANLQDVDLSEADLRGANLQGALINQKTNLKGAIYNTQELKVDKINSHLIESLQLIFKPEYIIREEVNLKATNFSGVHCIEECLKEQHEDDLEKEKSWQTEIQKILDQKKMQRNNKP